MMLLGVKKTAEALFIPSKPSNPTSLDSMT